MLLCDIKLWAALFFLLSTDFGEDTSGPVLNETRFSHSKSSSGIGIALARSLLPLPVQDNDRVEIDKLLRAFRNELVDRKCTDNLECLNDLRGSSVEQLDTDVNSIFD